MFYIYYSEEMTGNGRGNRQRYKEKTNRNEDIQENINKHI